MKSVMLRVELVELDDHGTDSMPDETILYQDEREVGTEFGLNPEVMVTIESQIETALQQYECEHEDIITTSDGFTKRCSDCGKDMTYLAEPDYDEIAKDQRIEADL